MSSPLLAPIVALVFSSSFSAAVWAEAPLDSEVAPPTESSAATDGDAVRVNVQDLTVDADEVTINIDNVPISADGIAVNIEDVNVNADEVTINVKNVPISATRPRVNMRAPSINVNASPDAVTLSPGNADEPRREMAARSYTAELPVIEPLPADRSTIKSREEIAPPPAAEPAPVDAERALAIHRYFYVDFPRRVQAVANERALLEAELAMAERRVASFEPFRGFGRYGATYFTAQAAQIDVTALRQRIACLENVEADLWRERQVQAALLLSQR